MVKCPMLTNLHSSFCGGGMGSVIQPWGWGNSVHLNYPILFGKCPEKLIEVSKDSKWTPRRSTCQSMKNFQRRSQREAQSLGRGWPGEEEGSSGHCFGQQWEGFNLPVLNQTLYSVLFESKILDILIFLSRWERGMDGLGQSLLRGIISITLWGFWNSDK